MYFQSRLLWTFAHMMTALFFFCRISFDWKQEILTWLFNLQPHQTNLNFKLSRHLHKSTSWGRTGSSLSLLHLYHPAYYCGFFIRCHPGKNKELYCSGLEGTGGREPERELLSDLRWEGMWWGGHTSRLPADCWNQASAPRALTFCPEGPKGHVLRLLIL